MFLGHNIPFPAFALPYIYTIIFIHCMWFINIHSAICTKYLSIAREEKRRERERERELSIDETTMMMGGGSGGGGGGGRMVLPGWLEGLVEESFFVGCGSHESRKKNEKNIFCLGCCTSICTHCVSNHPSHPLIQVRRYVYNDVVRLDNLEKLIDCSYVQPYTINSAKVVFLKPRPQSRPFKGTGNLCLTCDRILQEPFHFCCLSCKVDHVVLQGEDLSSILFRFDESDLTFSHFENLRMDGPDLLDDGQTTPNSILEDPLQYNNRGSSSRGNSDFEVPKRKKKGSGFFPQLVLSLSSRRKGAPHRSPLS